MTEGNLNSEMLASIEGELSRAIDQLSAPEYGELRHMLAYHMGWEGEGAGPGATGKRIRPLLVLLTTASAKGVWHTALPAAAAVELIHNFSLIHDDIEDNSPMRRGRPTVWYKWGIPQAVNTGDALFTIAHLEIMRLEAAIGSEKTLSAARILQNTCLKLTKGQYLDISYEGRTNLSLDDYWPMISGKTGALISACTELGALIAGADCETQSTYREFGVNLGLAFQALDDLLGIWGDSAVTGKSAQSDIVSGKKSLPVLYGLSQNGRFAERWREGPIEAHESEALSIQLESEGARLFTQETAARFTDQALTALHRAQPVGAAGEALTQLANHLLRRRG